MLLTHTRDQTTGKQLCRLGPWGPGGKQVDHKPAKHPHGKESNSMLGCVRQSVASWSRV